MLDYICFPHPGFNAPNIIKLCVVIIALYTPYAPGGSLSGPISTSSETLELTDYLTLPATSASNPRARVNFLKPAPDGSARIFINDLRGPLYILDQGALHTFFDLALLKPDLKTSPGLATGFVSFALHPDYASNGKLYTVHTEFVASTPPSMQPPLPITPIQHSIVTEWTATDPSSNTFSGTSRELIRIPSPHRFHNIGEVAFNPFSQFGSPDYGLLYFGLGDFNSVELGQPDQLQRLDSPYGTIMRIDPLAGSGAAYSYGIPPDNPYAGSPDPAVLQEIVATGFRNPHRFSWVKETIEALFIIEIGQGNMEEINIMELGGNYGWPLREGSYALDPEVDPETVYPLPPNDTSFGFSYPVAQYDHEEGFAIAGGFGVNSKLYRHSPFGKQFIYGDIVNGRIFQSDIDDMISNNDGIASTTAAIQEIQLLYNGSSKTLLQIVRDELGDQSLNRVDLRFAYDGTGNYFIMTKQDGVIRRVTIPANFNVPLLNPVYFILLSFSLISVGVRRSTETYFSA